MSHLDSEAAPRANTELYLRTTKVVGNVPNTFALGGHGIASFKAIPAADAVPYLHIVVERSTRHIAGIVATVVLFGLLSIATVMAQEMTNPLTDPPVKVAAIGNAAATTPAGNGANAPTSHRPWLAPVGHRQPRRADVPHDEGFAARASEQLLLDKVTDQSLIICRC